jgi:magnesium transporter
MYRIAHINGKKAEIEETESIDKLKIRKDEFVWVDVRAKSMVDLQALKKRFKLHKLAIEDCVAPQERAKLEKFPGYKLILIKAASFEKKLEVRRLSIFVGKEFILTISKKDHDFVKKAMDELTEKGAELSDKSPDSLAYLLIDRVVDMYFPVLESIESEIESIETKILGSADKNTLKKIFKVKKDLLTFRKSVWPVREMASALARDPHYSNKELGPYYRDINDHVVLIMDLVESYRDMLSNAMESYLSSVSNSGILSSFLAFPSQQCAPDISTLYELNFQNS